MIWRGGLVGGFKLRLLKTQVLGGPAGVGGVPVDMAGVNQAAPVRGGEQISAAGPPSTRWRCTRPFSTSLSTMTGGGARLVQYICSGRARSG